MSDPHISVVILNYNAGSLLLESVSCVLDSDVPTELFVCDNHSTDGSLFRLKSVLRWRGEDAVNNIHFIENKENIGFSAAVNIALAEASGQYVLLLNPDCLIKPNTLSQMLDVMEQRPDVGMAGCRILNEDGSEQVGCRRKLPTPMSGLLRSFNIRNFVGKSAFDLNTQPLPEHPVEVEAISGAFMLLRKSAIDDVGLMDESYFLHCEDLDYCKRFRERGWKVLFVPNVEVTHYKGTCSQSHPVRVEWHKHRGMSRYYEKFLAEDTLFLLDWLVRIGIVSRFLLVATKKTFHNIFSKQTSPANNIPISADLQCLQPWPACMSGKSVLVTGATGQVGRELVGRLLQMGALVSIITQNRLKAERVFPSGVLILQADLKNDHELMGICEGVDIVFHLASYPGSESDKSVEDSPQHFDVTVKGTRNLVNTAIATGVKRIVFASSVRASDPKNNYGRSKREAEQLLLLASDENDLNVSILRFPAIYGSTQHGNIARMIEAIDRHRFPPVPEFHDRRSMIHQDDVVRALMLAACQDAANNEVYTVTDGERYSTRRLYCSITAALGRKLPDWSIPETVLQMMATTGDHVTRLTRRALPFNTQVLEKLRGSGECDGSRFARELGFQPCYNLESALPEMVKEYRQAAQDKAKP